uniref:Type II and III secretion system protein n=1 Tax=Schlesneria paludicola TaxID=360056 RepID=A0A7C2K1H0_9PLAN
MPILARSEHRGGPAPTRVAAALRAATLLVGLLDGAIGAVWGQVLGGPPIHASGIQPSGAPTGPLLPLPASHPSGPIYSGADNIRTLPVAPASQIQPVQNTADSARAIHHLIESLPTSQDELEVIERRSQLMITRAKVVRWAIADTAIIDVVQYSPRELGIIGLARGNTTLTLWFENHPDPIIYLVKTIRDPDLDNQRKLDYGRLEQRINRLFPNSKVYLIPMSRKILVRGQARDQEEAAHILMVVRGEVINQLGDLLGPQPYWGNAAAGGGPAYPGAGFNLIYSNGGAGLWGTNDLLSSFIINELRVPGEFQISLRVRIAELNRSQLRRMGIDFNVLFNDTQNIFTNMGGALGTTIGGIFEDGDITVLMNFLASNGTAKILTEPNVVVLSGRQARFLAGGEFAVPTTVGIGGAAGQTTSFRGFGTSLLVTPVVTDRDNIRISATAEYSDLNNGNSVGGIPGTNARRVETTVEMREGQTLALAGLLSHRTVTEVTRIPWLGDIPHLGPLLFSNKRSTQEENELLILITPEIVRPMDPHEVPPVPGSEVTHPIDHEFYKHNMTEGMPDTGYYQLPPYGSGSQGTNVGYQHFNPGPAGSMYSPQPTNPYGQGFSLPPSSPTPIPPTVPPATLPGPGYTPPPSPGTPIPQRLQAVPQGAMRTPSGGWSAPAPNSQTIVPTNYTSPATPARSARILRDSQGSGRY